MNKSKGLIICLAIGIFLIAIGLVYYSKRSNTPKETYKFNVTEANYDEKNYDRYLAYKEKHQDYTDDKIVTYVNIGLDHDFYTNVIETKESDGVLKITNKYHSLSKDFTPQLVTVPSTNIQMDQEAADSLTQMMTKALEREVNLHPEYGYISYDDQAAVYNTWTEYLGEGKVDKQYAKQGYSDFQTGLAVAFGPVNEDFEGSIDFAWLKEFAHEFGFILRYPKDKEAITGYSYNPCYYRYVGKEAAKVIHDKNITLEEYYATYVLK